MYDVTVVYPGAKGEDCPRDERDLLEDKFPEKIHFHIRRFQEWSFSSFFAEATIACCLGKNAFFDSNSSQLQEYLNMC